MTMLLRAAELISVTWTGGAKIYRSNPVFRPVQVHQFADQGRVFMRQMRFVDIRIGCICCQQEDFLWWSR